MVRGWRMLWRRGFATKLQLGRLNHVAIATRDLASQVHLYHDIMGAEVSERQVSLECELQ